jgi:hypothetical protein
LACPDIAERFGSDDATWPTRVAAKEGISTTTVVEGWASGFNYVLDLATRLASYCRTFIVEAFAVQRCVAVRVSVSAH